MELRPSLTPPALNATTLARLAKLADRLDGAAAGRRDNELAEFNRIAGREHALADFQGIHKSEDPEDFARRVLFRRALVPDPTISLAEMIEIVSRIDDDDFYLELFLVNCKHPSGTDLIYWPNLVPELPQGREPTAEEIAEVALRGKA